MAENASSNSVHVPDMDRIKIDQAMVERINARCVDSWHAFVERYSNLIYHVLRRQLIAEDEEAIHTVFVDTLKKLYETSLRDYRGKSSLTTWVVLVTRAIAVEHLRRKRGRRRYPKGYSDLDEFSRRVFKLHFIEGLGFDCLIHALRWQGESYTVVDIARAVLVIEETVDRHYLRRLEFDRAARAAGASSGVELQYVLGARAHHENKMDSDQPERILIEKEADELRNRVAALWEGLPAQEKELVDLRFKFRWSAARISRHLGLDGQRQVYRLTNTILKKMRKTLVSIENVLGG